MFLKPMTQEQKLRKTFCVVPAIIPLPLVPIIIFVQFKILKWKSNLFFLRSIELTNRKFHFL